MNGSSKSVMERLYLHKDETTEIYVDSLLHQHHIDGIRFLYTQFKKKNPGVIINNPLGYGNSLLVALFLGAIQHILDKPILILCEESKEMTWLDHFHKLANCYNVGIAAESPFVKKSIFINSMKRLEQFCRRDWSVMVVDNDMFLKEKALQSKFKADFKIWITPYDMKDNMQTFAIIYKWLYPKEKLNIDEYSANSGKIGDSVAKAILLDAFLHDIVCKTHLPTPFQTPYTEPEETPKTVLKKNKDITGTKIKRSKRLSDSAGTSNGIQENIDIKAGARAAKVPKKDKPETNTGDFSIGNFRINHESTKQCDVIASKNSEMDVESFIRNEKPINYDPSKEYKQEYDNISHNSEESRSDLMEDEPKIFDTPEKRTDHMHLSDDAVDIPEIQKTIIDRDMESDTPISKNESSQDFLSLYDRKLATPKLVTDNNIINDSKEEISDTHNPDTTITDNTNDTELEKPVKSQEPVKIVKESPKKDVSFMLKSMDEQISKKFQGSLLDRLF